ncbi:hypothetical protein NDU88_005965 [Pleurodeles waltl]|uniref:Secreted protein n=1 Tax=Pleurodeles waltl TaxID=8319 RepID=A0AAV7MAW8_PLEWA|nr:hypothetical protein NDU88_005965 [Pleurodeles waltl]
MSRVCAWILLLIFRLRVVLRGCASKFRSHGRRRVDFSLEVGRRCPCEAVRRNFGLTAGVASISPWKSGGVVLARPCVKVSHSRYKHHSLSAATLVHVPVVMKDKRICRAPVCLLGEKKRTRVIHNCVIQC